MLPYKIYVNLWDDIHYLFIKIFVRLYRKPFGHTWLFISSIYSYQIIWYLLHISDNGKCSSKDMRKTPLTIFQYVTPNGTHSGHISPIANIMRFSKEYGVQYIGPDKVSMGYMYIQYSITGSKVCKYFESMQRIMRN